MNAAEIIEMIRKLPPEEKAEVLAFVQKETAGGRVEEAGVEPKVSYIPLTNAEQIAEGVFDRHSELFKKLAQ